MESAAPMTGSPAQDSVSVYQGIFRSFTGIFLVFALSILLFSFILLTYAMSLSPAETIDFSSTQVTVTMLLAFVFSFLFVFTTHNLSLRVIEIMRKKRNAKSNAEERLNREPGPYPSYGTQLRLQKYANQISRRASTVYWTMILSLIVGLLLIIFAGKLANLDSTFSTVLTQLAAERSALIDNNSRNLNDGKQFIVYLTKTLTDPGADRALLQSQLQDESQRLKTLQEKFDARLTALIDEERQARVLWLNRSVSGPDSKSDWNWSSIILRISVIGLLVFLTQILISLYRYNSSLVVFYQSRRDALAIGGNDVRSVQPFIDLLYPATLNFGRAPVHPLQEMANLLRAVGAKADEAIRASNTADAPKGGRKKAATKEPPAADGSPG